MKNVKKFNKKLVLRKMTVSNLDKSELKAVNGGLDTNSLDPITCPPTNDWPCNTYNPEECGQSIACPTVITCVGDLGC